MRHSIRNSRADKPFRDLEHTHVQWLHGQKEVLSFAGTRKTGPAGRRVVSVPHYDFNWQTIYCESKPREVPKGTRIDLYAHWDNSVNNRMNPDRKAEMIFAWVGVVVPRDTDPDKVMAKPVVSASR